MTQEKNENGNQPAFAIVLYPEMEADIKRGFPFGLTKREYFAGMALSVYGNHQSYYSANPEELAKRAVECADALLAQLNNSNNL